MKDNPKECFAFALERRPVWTPRDRARLAETPEEYEDEVEWSSLRTVLKSVEPDAPWLIGDVLTSG